MKKNLFYVLILLLLGVAIYFFIIKKENTTLDAQERKFNVEDTGGIYKINISDMSGAKISLEKKPTGWWVNDHYLARRDAINTLLSTIKTLSIKYPVALAANNNVIKDMAAEHKKVDIYDKSGQVIRSYYVGAPVPGGDANYMKTDHGRTAFAVCIPGFVGTVDVRYIISENEMRSRNIFNFPLMAIKEVTVNYPDKPDSSFSISVPGLDSFVVKRLSDNKIIDAKSINKDRVGSYLSLFHFINAEAYENDNKQKDTILMQKPFCIITLTDRNNTQHAVQCYYKPLTQSSLIQYDTNGKALPHDIDRYFATINDGKDFVLIQRFQFGRLLQKFNFFLNSPPAKKK